MSFVLRPAPFYPPLLAPQIGTHLAACVLQQVDPLSLVGEEDPPEIQQGNGYSNNHNPSVDVGNGRSRDGGYSDPAGPPPSNGAAVPATTTISTTSGTSTQDLPPTFEYPRCVSATLPGGVHYVRVELPPSSGAQPKRPGSASTDRSREDDGYQGGGNATSAAAEGSNSAVKSFATGSLDFGGRLEEGLGMEDEASEAGAGGERGCGRQGAEQGGESGEERKGGYCVVRVDSLDRVCGIIYCGFERVEAQNLSRVVGVHMGYLQVRNGGMSWPTSPPAENRDQQGGI